MKLTLLFLLLIVYYSCGIRHPKKTIAVYEETGFNHRSLYAFYSNGKKYTGTDWYIFFDESNLKEHEMNRKADCETLGSAYEVVYDSLNPIKNQINRCVPIFLPNDSISSTYGTIFYTDKKCVVYQMDNPKVYKYQFICPDTMLKYKDVVKVGNVFEVKYVTNHPRIAILYLNKQVID